MVATRPRLNLSSTVVLILAVALAAFLTLGHSSDGFGGHRGFPFRWYESYDVIVDGKVLSGFFWDALVADVAIWLALIAFLAVLLMRREQRLAKDPGSGDPT